VRAGALAQDVAALASGYPRLARLVKATVGLATYVENNAGAITDYAERWDHGEIISTAFAESTVDLVVSRRFAKNSRCSGPRKALIGSCRPEPAPSTARCATRSPPGIRPCPSTMSSPPHSLPQPELPHGFWCSPADSQNAPPAAPSRASTGWPSRNAERQAPRPAPHSIALLDFARSRSWNFWILPVEVLGISSNLTSRGTL
jgi:hypothetical protein